jgi:hypothetical protein
MASPAWVTENPCRVIYRARNGITNVPNLFKNDPPQRTQTGRGNVRKVAIIPGLGAAGAVVVVAWSIENKKPCRPFGGQGSKCFQNLHLAPLPTWHFHAQSASVINALDPGRPLGQGRLRNYSAAKNHRCRSTLRLWPASSQRNCIIGAVTMSAFRDTNSRTCSGHF